MMDNEAKPADYAMLWATCLQAAATEAQAFATAGDSSLLVRIHESAQYNFDRALKLGRDTYLEEDQRRRGLRA